ncbi:MAG: hypothetical protein JXQ73_13215 [Phycisphaerae bacterium]|nr:hypothetical protein [Phycisphaerae bacterium]
MSASRKQYPFHVLIAVAVLGVTASRSARAEERHVPSPNYPTIQSAINACADGDEVVIAPGRYSGAGNYDLTLDGKVITLRGTDPNDPNVVAATTIDPERAGRGLSFTVVTMGNPLVDGITVTNGKADVGGGVLCEGGNPTFRNCHFIRNLSQGAGGAMYLNCETVILDNCFIADNRAIAIPNTTSGGAICAHGGYLTAVNCRILRNECNYRAGAIMLSWCDATLTQCAIVGNKAGSTEGAIRCYGSNLSLAGCVLADNDSPDGYQVTIDPQSQAWVDYCDVVGGQPTFFVDSGHLYWGVGNIDADPMLTPHGNLKSGSPCLDMGDPNYAASPGETDADGEPRVTSGRVDIGPDEFLDTDSDGMQDWWEGKYFGGATAGDPAADTEGDGRINPDEYNLGSNPLQDGTMYVAEDGDDAHDGLAPAWDGQHGPKATIRAAIEAAEVREPLPCQITVAPGTYVGSGNRNIQFWGLPIHLRSTDPNDNAVVAATVIDPNGDGRGLTLDWGEDANAILDGVTVRHGRTDQGGAIFCGLYACPTVRNCRFVRNVSDGDGGAVFITRDGAWPPDSTSPTFVNCQFADNHAKGLGGAVYVTEANPVFKNCLFIRNAAETDGGAVAFFRGSQEFQRCTFVDNRTKGQAGAIYSDGWSVGSIALTDCAFSNESLGDGYEIVLNVYQVNIAYCVIPRGQSAVQMINGTLQWGAGNLDGDPLLTADGHLKSGSPCLDAGDPNVPPDPNVFDIDNETRIVSGRIDVGADEFIDTDADGLPDWWEQKYFDDPTAADPNADPDLDGRDNLSEYELALNPITDPKLYVSTSGDDAWDGLASSWDGQHGPKATIQAAILAAESYEPEACEIIVAPGSYVGPGNHSIRFFGAPIRLSSTDPNDPNVLAATVIDCQGTPEAQTRGFVFDWYEQADAQLVGLSLVNGNGKGGLVYCEAASPTVDRCSFASSSGGPVYYTRSNGAFLGCLVIANSEGSAVSLEESDSSFSGCTFSGNTSESEGAAIYCLDANTLSVSGCTFNGNTSEWAGGAIYCRDANMAITTCEFTGNSGQGYGGGAVYFRDGDISILSSSFTNNSSTGSGGALDVVFSNAEIGDSTFEENAADGSGGAVSCPGSNMTLTGCTAIDNTSGAQGGGFYWSNIGLRLVDCTITGNSAETYGGAVAGAGGGCSIAGSVIEGNLAAQNDGGAVYCQDAYLTVLDCTLRENEASWQGGAISGNNARIVVTDTTVQANTAGYNGGGICASAGTMALTRCGVSGNSSSGRGGGLYTSDLSPSIACCTIAGNDSALAGGGIYCKNSSSQIANSMICGNVLTPYAILGGAGVYIESGDALLGNCTLSDNAAGQKGGGIYCKSSSVELLNCIAWANTATNGHELGLNTNATVTVSYSDIEGGPNDVLMGTDCTLDWGDGNIDADPLLKNPAGPDGDPNTVEDNDYHIQSTSPCRNTGDPNGNYTDQTDIDGNNRVVGSAVDIGADEYNCGAGIGVMMPSLAVLPFWGRSRRRRR